jgi:hypothetical protein
MNRRQIIQEIRVVQYLEDGQPKRQRPRRESRRELRARREREGGGMTSQRNPRGFDWPTPTELPCYDGRSPHGDHHHDGDGGHLGEELV